VLNTTDNKKSLGTRTALNSLSATSFCIQLDHKVAPGDELMVMTQLAHAILLLRAEVTDIKHHQQGPYCVSLRIKQHQIFSSLSTGERFGFREATVKELPLGETSTRIDSN
jgi:hypothetical protein